MERHGGVQRERQGARPRAPGRAPARRTARRCARAAVRAGWRPSRRALDEPGQGVVRDGQEDQVGALQDLRGESSGTSGRSSAARRLEASETPRRPPGGAPGELERRGEGGADPARADNADGEPRGAVLGVWLVECASLDGGLPFQSARGTGRFLVMLTRLVRASFSLSTGCGFPQVAGGAENERMLRGGAARDIIRG